jgi:hypothetical protein
MDQLHAVHHRGGAERPGHPFFLLSLFQPELADASPRPRPIIRAFAVAAEAHARQGAIAGRFALSD